MALKIVAPSYVAFVLAVAAAGIAALLQWILLSWTGAQTTFLFFLLALVFSVIFLGRNQSLIILIAGVVDGIWLSPPTGAMAIQSPRDLAGVIVFAVTGAIIVAYGSRLRSSVTRAALAEQRLALAQKNTGVGIFELDFERQTAFVSPGLCQMLGRPETPGEIDLAVWLGGLRADHVEESRRVMQEHISRGNFNYEREQQFSLADGEIRWVLNRVELEATAAGALRIARGVAVDITDRKHMDQKLQRAQESLQQQLQDVIRLHTFSQRLLSTADNLPAALQSLLDTALEIYSAQHGILSLVDTDTDTGASQVLAQAGVSVQSIPRHTGISAAELHRVLAAEQSLQGLQTLPLLSAQGQVMGLLSIMRAEPLEQCERERRLAEVCAASAAAVVERERARAVAISNEQRFSVALESSAVPFSILTPLRSGEGTVVDFEWTYINPSGARALGRQVVELVGREIGSVLPAAWEAPGLFERYVSVLESNEQCEFEIQTAASNQGSRWYNVLAAPLEGSLAVWFMNITARKEHEEAMREADRRKDEFLATLAHELRNPLAPIRQAVRVSAAANSTDAQRRWSNAMIERQVQHMSLLLDDLLDVSRIGRGTLLLRKSHEQLAVVMEAAVDAARPHLEAKRHRLEKSLPADPVLLDIDPVRIAQVLGNLLTNAAKYTDPDGQIQLNAQFEDSEFVIRVKDNGIGLTPEQQTQVFEMFSQVPEALQQSQGGLGIGLALARGLVELHGGSIRAESAGLGHGTEVIVRLPGSCVVSDPAGQSLLLTAEPGAPTGILKRCILIADDNADAADSLAELLRFDGHDVHVVYNGAAAVATFARVDPDAVLLDVGMPDMSGHDVARAIRQQPAGRRATLIAVTGWGQDRDRRLALDAGFDHHLTKPMDPEKISDLIQRGRLSETV